MEYQFSTLKRLGYLVYSTDKVILSQMTKSIIFIMPFSTSDITGLKKTVYDMHSTTTEQENLLN